jgi:hypothetical protein
LNVLPDVIACAGFGRQRPSVEGGTPEEVAMKWSTLALLSLGSFAVLPLGCGGDDDSNGGTSDGDADADTDSDADADADADVDADADADADGDADNPADYPPPPYGVVAGDTVDNLSFIGPNNQIIKLGDFYQQDDGAKLLMVFATAGWCYWCAVENETLLDWDPQYRADGLRILGVVFEDDNANPADADYADHYFGADGYDVQYDYAADPYFSLGAFFDKAATPLNMFIDLDTMQIISVSLGWGEASYRELIESRLYGQ